MGRDSRRLIVLTIAVLLLFSACSSEDPSVVFDGRHYRLVRQGDGVRVYEDLSGDSTLSIETMSGEWAYAVQIDDERYLISGDARAFSVRFPDDRVLSRTHSGSVSSGSAPMGTPTTFDDWDTVDALGALVFGSPAADPSGRSAGTRIIGLVLMISGLISIINPRLAFFLELGWRLRDSEPSDLYLAFSRGVGVVLTIAGIFLLLA